MHFRQNDGQFAGDARLPEHLPAACSAGIVFRKLRPQARIRQQGGGTVGQAVQPSIHAAVAQYRPGMGFSKLQGAVSRCSLTQLFQLCRRILGGSQCKMQLHSAAGRHAHSAAQSRAGIEHSARRSAELPGDAAGHAHGTCPAHKLLIIRFGFRFL